MKISILVPIYNVANYIERCAVSLFEQTYKDIEYIFVNDCTQDNSIEILEQTLERYPERKEHVRIINHERNKGLAGARITAIHAANTEFVIQCDSDDWMELDMCEKMCLKQQETGADIVRCNSYYHFPDRIEKTNIALHSTPQGYLQTDSIEWVTIWCLLVRRNLIIENSIYPVHPYCEDISVTLRYFYFAKTIAYVTEPIYHHDKTNDSSMTAVNKNNTTLERALQMKENIDVVFTLLEERGYNWTKGEYRYKKGLRDGFLHIKPIPWKYWREAYPEIIPLFMKDSSMTIVYRLSYYLAHKEFTFPLLLLRHLPSLKKVKSGIKRLLKKQQSN